MIEKDAPEEPDDPAVEPQIPDSQRAELVRRALSGERKARQLLCEELLPLFQQVAAKLVFRFRTVTRETARQEEMDILQHIVGAFLEELHDKAGVVTRWRPEQGPLEAWLRPFATCRGLDHLRKRKDSRHLSFDAMTEAIQGDLRHLHTSLSSSTVDLEGGDALRKLCDAVLRDPALGPEALQLLERIFWNEEDRELVARSLGIKRNTLDVRVKRIRGSLLKLCAELGLPFGQSAKREKTEKKDEPAGSKPALPAEQETVENEKQKTEQ